MDFQKVKISEMLCDSQGKSSLGLLLGFIWGVLGSVVVLTGVVAAFLKLVFFTDLLSYGMLVLGLSGTTIGIRRLSKDKEILTIEKEENKENI